MERNDFYRVELARYENGYGVGRGWMFYISPEKIGAFTVDKANELLEFGTKEFENRFGEKMDFNHICLIMGGTTGRYWRDENKLRIYRDGMPIYENNNGIICRDCVAISDGV